MNKRLAHEIVAAKTDDASHAATAARIKIDYERIMSETAPDRPGGRTVFSTANFTTEKEADAAFEAFVDSIVEAPYDEY